MFPYSLGVQAPTIAKAKSDLAAQIDQLGKQHPEAFKAQGAHVKGAQAAAEAVANMLSADDDSTDVAISVHGQLKAKNSEDPKKPDEVSDAEFHVYAGRVPSDPSKHAKVKPGVVAAPLAPGK